MNTLEEGNELMLDFKKLVKAVAGSPEILPVAVQHADTGEVILLAYTNRLAFEEALKKKRAIFWSTSRNELWEKGKQSGETFDLIDVYVNCEQNSLLYKVRPRHGKICHTRNRAGTPRNCFYRRLNPDAMTLDNLDP